MVGGWVVAGGLAGGLAGGWLVAGWVRYLVSIRKEGDNLVKTPSPESLRIMPETKKFL